MPCKVVLLHGCACGCSQLINQAQRYLVNIHTWYQHGCIIFSVCPRVYTTLFPNSNQLDRGAKRIMLLFSIFCPISSARARASLQGGVWWRPLPLCGDHGDWGEISTFHSLCGRGPGTISHLLYLHYLTLQYLTIYSGWAHPDPDDAPALPDGRPGGGLSPAALRARAALATSGENKCKRLI